MPRINMNSVMKKVDEWSKSDAGKARIAKTLKERRENGNGKLASGDYITTIQDMQNMAEELIRTLKEEASSSRYELPQSVLNHFNSLTYTQPEPKANGTQYGMDIYFQDDLSRMSLLITSGKRKGQRTGGGIDNIVSLFDTGYRASKQVYGAWDTHGGDYDNGGSNDIMEVASRTKLEGKYFMENAVETFNRKYGQKYRLEARIEASPEFYSSFNYI